MRRRRQEAPPLELEPPEWIWQFRWKDWGLEMPSESNPVKVDDWHAARQQWRKACREWLDERGLVDWGHSNVTWPEFKRIRREEPHRILRRPDPPAP